MHKLKALICDDMEHARLAHEHKLHTLGQGLFHPITELAHHPKEALSLVKASKASGAPFDIALLDVDYRHAPGADDKDGFWAANEIHKVSPETVLIMISSYGTSENFALSEKSPWIERFLRRGEFQEAELQSSFIFALIRKLHRVEALLPPESVVYTESMVMEDYLKRTDRMFPHQNIVIYGETGTGKELTALRINANARVALGQESRPFVTINCGGLTPTLLTSELFGYVKGAFTGAHCDTPGLLERAEGGDLFLDELQNASRELQDILMRVLNDKQFTPVGGKRARQINVRFITALNQNPSEAKKSGALKGDLVARLQQGYLVIPPLRDRKGDIPSLVDRFKRLDGQADKAFSPEALTFLARSGWTTNVRGLRNVVRSAIQDSKVPVITEEAVRRLPLVREMLAEAKDLVASDDTQSTTLPGIRVEVDALVQRWLMSGFGLEEPIKTFEKQVLTRLWQDDPSIARVARRAKIPETTLRRKLVEYGIGA